MAQYRIGTVDVTSGSPVVQGFNTLWLANVGQGDVFVVRDGGVSYEVGSVDSNTQLTLTAPWAGPSLLNTTYGITRDFSPTRNYPLITRQDIETASIMRRALLKIDDDVYEATGPIRSSGNLVSMDTVVGNGSNAISVGPLTIANGVTVTVMPNHRWSIV